MKKNILFVVCGILFPMFTSCVNEEWGDIRDIDTSITLSDLELKGPVGKNVLSFLDIVMEKNIGLDTLDDVIPSVMLSGNELVVHIKGKPDSIIEIESYRMGRIDTMRTPFEEVDCIDYLALAFNFKTENTLPFKIEVTCDFLDSSEMPISAQSVQYIVSPAGYDAKGNLVPGIGQGNVIFETEEQLEQVKDLAMVRVSIVILESTIEDVDVLYESGVATYVDFYVKADIEINKEENIEE